MADRPDPRHEAAAERARDLQRLVDGAIDAHGPAASPVYLRGAVSTLADDVLALAADLERMREALERIAEPLCDAAFRARLLRQGLSTDEMAQYVTIVDAMQVEARDALAGGQET